MGVCVGELQADDTAKRFPYIHNFVYAQMIQDA